VAVREKRAGHDAWESGGEVGDYGVPVVAADGTNPKSGRERPPGRRGLRCWRSCDGESLNPKQ
jgi:hypothetical protein